MPSGIYVLLERWSRTWGLWVPSLRDGILGEWLDERLVTRHRGGELMRLRSLILGRVAGEGYVRWEWRGR